MGNNTTTATARSIISASENDVKIHCGKCRENVRFPPNRRRTDSFPFFPTTGNAIRARREGTGTSRRSRQLERQRDKFSRKSHEMHVRFDRQGEGTGRVRPESSR